jgi:hypothetical protein
MARNWAKRWAGAVVAGAFTVTTGCQSLHIAAEAGCDDGACAAPHRHQEPRVNSDPSMMGLATDLDHLEKHIDWYGSVTVKSPDVWGQQRLTRYREEFEKEMADEVGNFKLVLSGSQARSDQSYAAFAMSLGVAIQPPASPPPPAGSGEIKYLDPPIRKQSKSTTTTTYDANGKETKKTTVTEGPASPVPPPPPPPPPTKIEAPAADDPTKLVDASPSFERNKAILERVKFNKELQSLGVGLEPTEFLNQMQRYLNHLAQIRRNNEGDDTADSPGYSLNLIRLPVSVLPGKRTDRAHGAEVTMTIEPVLGHELLPSTFRNFVMNDLVKEFGFPLTKFLDGDVAKLLTEENRLVARNYALIVQIIESLESGILPSELIKKLPESLVAKLDQIPADEDRAERMAVMKISKDETFKSKIRGFSKAEMMTQRLTDSNFDRELKSVEANHNFQESKQNEIKKQKYEQLRNQIGGLLTAVRSAHLPYSTGTRNKQAIPFSQFFEVHGAAFPFEIAFQAQRALGGTIKEQGYAHLPDVQAFLSQELDAAYRMLKEPKMVELWHSFCNQHVVFAIRSRNGVQLENYRTQFRERLWNLAGFDKEPKETDRQAQFTATAACAWAILVQSALLNDRLMLDMKETADQQHCAPFTASAWLDCYLPDPSPEARTAFNEYVKKRWPIKVFALDPINDEQNVADALSTRRELQLALAVAFKSGKMNGNSFGKFARRLEAEYEAIDLNRTQIAFGHGDNTFGWRFYPRFQTPPTRSNAVVLLRDQLIGGPNKSALLRERRLEPGMRECTALVIMPSFVPNVQIETTTNWFGLANPKHKVFDHTQHLNLSRVIKATQQACLTDANCYRDGDDRRLKNRVEQLANRLPMQTLTTQVPVESNVGGHELFIHGTTDLAPELYGWYGAPGVKTDTEGFSLFLVGNHFSVTQTTVLVGNTRIERGKYWMISRQVMRVEIPKNAMTFKDAEGKRVLNIHVATPYGVSREITVPDISVPATPAVQAGLPLATDVAVVYKKAPQNDGKYALERTPVGAKAAAYLQWPDSPAPGEVGVELTFEYLGCPLAIVLKEADGVTPKKLKIKGGVYQLSNEDLDAIVKELFDRLNRFGPFTNETNPLKDGTLTPKIILDGGNAGKKEPTKAVSFQFKCSIP